jgi:BlaI family transcriptional regulator, penicillinase repressor
VARRTTPQLTDAELRLMEVLWQKGSATVSEVVENLSGAPPLAYSSVITTLRILEKKGHVRHTKDGRAFVYEPAMGRQEAREGAIGHLVRRFFGGSPERLMLSLLENQKIDDKELRRLRRKIAEEREDQ